jgi:hypothetical protein
MKRRKKYLAAGIALDRHQVGENSTDIAKLGRYSHRRRAT